MENYKKNHILTLVSYTVLFFTLLHFIFYNIFSRISSFIPHSVSLEKAFIYLSLMGFYSIYFVIFFEIFFVIFCVLGIKKNYFL